MCARSLQSCLTLCNPTNCSPPGSSVHGILQARIPEWIAISSSRGSSQPRDWTRISCISRQILYCWAIREAAFLLRQCIISLWMSLCHLYMSLPFLHINPLLYLSFSAARHMMKCYIPSAPSALRSSASPGWILGDHVIIWITENFWKRETKWGKTCPLYFGTWKASGKDKVSFLFPQR